MIEEYVLHLAGSRSPSRGSGWAAVLRSASGDVVAKSSGGEAGASSYLMELVALLRGLQGLPQGASLLRVRSANQTLLTCCASFVATGELPRKAAYKSRMRQLPRLLASLDADWVDTSRGERDEWDKQAKSLARASAVPDAGGQVGEPPADSPGAVPPEGELLDEASEPAEPPRVIAFTDGGCRGNPGLGGWAFLVVDSRTHAALEQRGGEPHTTNNRMEMSAAIRALEAVKGKGQHVEVRSDSQYLVNMCSRWITGWKAKGWRRKGRAPIQNLDLVKRLDELLQVHVVRWTWVRGHSGVKGNEYVDQLANRAMDVLTSGGDPAAERRHGRGESPVRVKVQVPAEARAGA